jgi:predicted glycosyltransferase
MNIWIDLDNSPHVPFFVPIISELRRRGHRVDLTARDAFQVCELADLHDLRYKKVGHHYGKRKALKAYGLAVRTVELLPTALRLKPDIAVSHGSRSQMLACALAGITSLVILDYEFAQHLVFSSRAWIMAPAVIPDTAIDHDRERILKYPGIKEDVYVSGFRPDPSLKQQLGIEEGQLVLTIRPPANEAHYHNSESEELFDAAIDLVAELPNAIIVLLPRNDKQEASCRNKWPQLFSDGKIIIPKHAVDGLNLIWHSDLVISGGGTMNREAAALGVPVYSIFRGQIGAVDKYLAEMGRLVLLHSPGEVRTRVRLEARSRNEWNGELVGDALGAIVNSIVKVGEARC